MLDSFKTHKKLQVQGKEYQYCDLKTLPCEKLPYTLRILLENCLRREDGAIVTKAHIDALLSQATEKPQQVEISFMPSRVLLQDFTGVPAIVDLAAMRDAMHDLGGDPQKINPLQAAELVIDHSVQVDKFGSKQALDANSVLEFHRNKERYAFLRWGQSAFSNFKVVPPSMGIVHQVNLEYLARVVFEKNSGPAPWAYPDTLVGTDSHTTMINGLGVLGWGVGGIEAEAALLGQSISMMIPQVVGFELTGQLLEGATATDLVLTVTEMLRKKGVVGKFVEFFGAGLDYLPLADRATIANMAPEYGATCGFFPVDDETLAYLELSGRSPQQIELVRQYAKAQGLFREAHEAKKQYSATLSLDLSQVHPSIAGPKRPQDRIAVKEAKGAFASDLASDLKVTNAPQKTQGAFTHGAVVIAAITSCTNTSNPAVMLAAGLVAKKACEKGLTVPDYVKTSLAPGSRVVTEYLEKAGLTPYLDQLGFNLVGYGCTTCIGNSGPLPEEVSSVIGSDHLSVCAVLSGNRNFEGRIHPEVRMNYLASPPLVIIYALAGTMNIDLYQEPIGHSQSGEPIFMRDLWPTQEEISALTQKSVTSEQFTKEYAQIFAGDTHWQNLEVPTGDRFTWEETSTYVKKPPYFAGMTLDLPEISDIRDARCLAKLGDSVTTDHISPAGAIKVDSPAGRYLKEHQIDRADFNSYGSRRGNHEIMMRGTFANVRLRNLLAPGTEGGVTRLLPEDQEMSIFDAAMAYQDRNTPLIILAGKEYGSGSSRDWAAKGPRLLGIKAVIAESYERIHRSNLVGMGILPLEYQPGDNADSLQLSGREVFQIIGFSDPKVKTVQVTAVDESNHSKTFSAVVRLDTPQEVRYYQNGGILHYVLRNLLSEKAV